MSSFSRIFTVLIISFVFLCSNVDGQTLDISLANSDYLLSQGGLVQSMGLTEQDTRIVEKMISLMKLSPEQENAMRKVFYGESEPAAAPGLPQAFSLAQNFPNPFNPATTINYTVPVSSESMISLKVYDIRGKLVTTLVEGIKDSGSHTVFWNGTDSTGRKVPSGVYLYNLKAGSGFSQSRKMVLLK